MRKVNRILLNDIKNELYSNGLINQKELANKYKVSERTIRRYIKLLKEQELVIYKNKKWQKISSK